jgi:hypothetical protein
MKVKLLRPSAEAPCYFVACDRKTRWLFEDEVSGEFLVMCSYHLAQIKATELPEEPRFKVEQVGTVGFRVIDTADVDNEAVVNVTVQKLTHGYGTTFLPTKEQAEAICKVANEVWG